MKNGTNRETIAGLEPAAVWDYFSRITDIPHPSKGEEWLRRAVHAMAKEAGFTAQEDGIGNIVIPVPASRGFEGAPVTVLQGHLDMVCEKNAATDHDFEREPVQLVLDRDASSGEEIVRADGTTLGADNGVGLAMALAAAFSPEVIHGPLELLFTVDEETGMTGAKALTEASVTGRRLLNLDSEKDDVIYIGCAGGGDANLSWEAKLGPFEPGAVAGRVCVSGLRGGHSGGDIHENRGTAIKLLARTLLRVDPGVLQIASFDGGQLRNAIPREAEARVVVPAKARAALDSAAKTVRDEAMRESGEEQVVVSVEQLDPAAVPTALSVTDSARLLAMLVALPHGVLGMHRRMSNLVETSNNLAMVSSVRDDQTSVLQVKIGALARSSSSSCQRVVLSQIAAVGRLAGAEVTFGNDYPGWEPNMDSPTLATCRRVYREQFGEEPNVTAIHAGLECGIIGERVGNMDMVSFGPRIEGAHSPDERVFVASVQKSWKFLQAVLAELARP
ncbi:MAG: beta-Ala-His dipeptidase [Planctomycetes bacterium]|nr:beta-Ala-His dipeptidase [Planctomycetota bacterium]